MASKIKLIAIVSLLITLLATTQLILIAQTTISVTSGPTWGDDGPYTAIVCSDTDSSAGDRVIVQMTDDGSALTGSTEEDPFTDWNGNIASCGTIAGDATSCPGEEAWSCSFFDSASATINYRFAATNSSNIAQAATSARTFNTGPTAVSLSEIGTNQSPITFLLITAAFILLGSSSIILLRRRRKAYATVNQD